MFCHNCGKKVEEGAAFCGECGAKQEIVREKTQVVKEKPQVVKEKPQVAKEKKGSKGVLIAILIALIIVLGAITAILLWKNFIQPKLYNEIFVEETDIVAEQEEDRVVSEQEEEKEQETDSASEEKVEIGKSEHEDTEDVTDLQQDYILPGSDREYLSYDDLEGFNAEELRIARNEIYARKGRRFNDEALQRYFDSKDWYVSIYAAEDFKEDMLNEYEKFNRDLITAYEYEKGFR